MKFMQKMIEKIMALRKTVKRRLRIIVALASVVVFATTYALILPGITLDQGTLAQESGVTQEAGAGASGSDRKAESKEISKADTDGAAGKEKTSESSESSKTAEHAAKTSDTKQKTGETDTAGQKKDTEQKKDTAQKEDTSQKQADTDEDLITAETALTYQADDYTVTVSFDKAAQLPKGVKLKVHEITKASAKKDYEAYQAGALKTLQNKDSRVSRLKSARFYDISFEKDGKTVEPSADVSVSIRYRDAIQTYSEKNIQAVHFKDNGKKEVVSLRTEGTSARASAKVKEVRFDADSFSVYGIVETELKTEWTISNPDGEDVTYLISVTYGSDANIPEGSTLRVTEYAEGTEDYVSARNAVLADKKAKDEFVDIENFGLAALDISIISPEGKEIEPDAPVQVDFKIKNLPDVDDMSEVVDSLEIQHHVETSKGIIVDKVFDGTSEATFEQETDEKIISEKSENIVDPTTVNEDDFIFGNHAADINGSFETSFSVDAFSTYTVTWWNNGNRSANVIYGYMNGNTFVPFSQGTPSPSYSANNGHALLVYDVEGYTYSYTARSSATGTRIAPVLRYSNNRWQYTTDFDSSHYTSNYYQNTMSWTNIDNNSNIYVVYTKDPEPTTGGTPQIDTSSETWPEGENAPQFSKSSVNNDDNTNTITLSIAAAEKEIEDKTKADVIVVFDVSGSMRYNMAGTQEYGNANSRADSINSNARLRIARNAVNAMADTLLSKNTGSNTGNNALVRMSLITFSTTATEVRDFTDTASTFKSSVNALTADGGTNWEQALELANQKAVRSDAATYIIFVSDGDPTFRISRGNYSDAQLDMNRAYASDGGYYIDYAYPYFRSNAVFGTGNSDGDNAQYTVRNYNPAEDVVESIKSHNKNFYAVGVSSDVTRMKTLVTDAGYAADNYKDGSDATKLAQAFEDIANSINSDLGFGNVEITDGITELTNMSMKVMETVDPNSFRYYRYGGEGNKYGSSEANMQEWLTREADGCAPASYNEETGAVEWNMGAGFQLEDKVTYVVKFRVWPSQAAYDLVANLNNGVKVYEQGHENSISAEEKAQVVELKAPSTDEDGNHIQGSYTLKTNTDTVEATYNKTTKTGDVVSISSTEDVQATYHPGKIENMDLESMQLTIKKVFEDGLTYQESTGQGEDRPDSVTLVLQRRDGNTYDASADTGFTPYAVGTIGPEITLNESNDWTATIFVAPGLKSGTEVLEKGYDFTITEPNINYHYGLIREVINPMVIDGEDAYVGDGQLLDGEQISDYTDRSLTAVNRVKSGIDVRKTTYDEDGTTVIKPDEEFTIHGRLVDSSGNGFTFNTDWDTRTDITGTAGASAEWIAHQNDTGAFHIYDQDGTRIGYKMHVANTADFTITLKGGQYIRFVNVPEGCKFEFYEVTGSMPDNFEWVSSTGVTQHRATPGGDLTPEGDTQPTVSGSGAVSLNNDTGVVGDKQYSINFNNKRVVKIPEVELVKVDKEDTSQKLNGAEFKLYADANKENEITKDANGNTLSIVTGDKEDSTTVPDGWYKIGPLDEGTYYLYETVAPAQHELNETPVIINVTKSGATFTVTATQGDSSVLSGPSDNVYTITVVNDRSTRWIQIRKVDMNSNPLGKAEFDFDNHVETVRLISYDPDTTIGEGDATVDVSGLMHDSNGVYTFELPFSDTAYTLTEKKAPAGYNMLTEVVNIRVQANEVTAMGADTHTSYAVTGSGTEEDPYVVAIRNSDGTVLPNTGGSGTLPYTLGGIALLAFAASMYGFRMRRRERRSN